MVYNNVVVWIDEIMDQELDILQHYKVISSKLKKLAWLLFTVMGAMLKLWPAFRLDLKLWVRVIVTDRRATLITKSDQIGVNRTK